jgi:hypothetical protein
MGERGLIDLAKHFSQAGRSFNISQEKNCRHDYSAYRLVSCRLSMFLIFDQPSTAIVKVILIVTEYSAGDS